jgi:hypothetical protein
MLLFPQHGFSFGLFMSTVVCLFTQACARKDFQERCLSFTPESYVENSTRQVLEYVPAGTKLTFPYNDPTCNRPSQVVSTNLCRVALSIPTSTRSSIMFEIWLPDIWSGRFLATGNGGLDGCTYAARIRCTIWTYSACCKPSNGSSQVSSTRIWRIRVPTDLPRLGQTMVTMALQALLSIKIRTSSPTLLGGRMLL